VFNTFSFLTLIKPTCRTTAVGVYLLCNTIFSEIALILAFSSIFYVNYLGRISINYRLSSMLCSSLPFLLPFLTQVTQWLTSLVTVHRALLTCAPTRFLYLRSARTAIMNILVSFVLSAATTVAQFNHHELMYDDLFKRLLCVSFTDRSKQTVSRISFMMNQAIPFLINVIFGSLIIVHLSRSKTKSLRRSRYVTFIQQSHERLDLLLGPLVYLITQAPQLIVFFIDTCTYDEKRWLAHLAIVAFFIAFLPHSTLFFAYIFSSPVFKKILLEETCFGRILQSLLRNRPSN
jgi:hypothetical protein